MNFPYRPEQASNFAMDYDALFFTISALTAIFTLMVMVLCIWLISKYKRGKDADRSNPVHHNTMIELVWSLISLVLGMGIFTWGTKLFIEMRQPPANAMEIFVVGKRWMWHIQHANGIRENNELHVPVGQPVKLTMISQDVIHAFYIPQFRVQYHVVPGRYTMLWFTATKAGKYNLFCSMHCGTQHSEMGGYVYAMERPDWQRWLASGGNRYKPVPETMVAAGEQLYKDFSCSNCHKDVDDMRAPSLNGLFGRKRTFNDGTSMIADQEYIRQSLLNPGLNVVKGYNVTMQPYTFSEEQILAIGEYLRTKGTATSEAAQSVNPAVINTAIPAGNAGGNR